jgi:SSS family solute:Na+ symporter
MNPTLTTLDYGIIVGYMVFAIAVGLILTRKASESSENYFLGGRNLPWWLVGISMIASSYASDTPLVVTEMIRQHGLQRLWWFLSGCIGISTAIFLFARLWRRAEITTDAELYEMRYAGRSAAFLRGFKACFDGIIHNFLIIAWVTLAMSSIIATMTPFDRWTAIGICVVVAVSYSVLSGFYGVVVTDFVQFFIAVFGMAALAMIAWNEVGGLPVILQEVSNAEGHGPETFNLLPDFSTLDADVFALLIFVFVLWWNDSGGYHMQRMSSCKNEKHAVLAIVFFGVFQTSRAWLWVGVALVSIVLFPDLSHTQFGDTQAFPMVMNTYLVPGMKGILVTAFLAAYMSTIDTHLNWGASYIMTDIYRRFLKPAATEKHYIRVTKVVVVLLMLMAMLIVPLLSSVTMAWELLALLVTPNKIICFVRWFWWRINAFTEITALVCSLIFGVVNLVLTSAWPQMALFGTTWGELAFTFKLTICIGFALPMALVATFLTPPVPREKLESFYRKVRPGGAWGVLDSKVRELPGKAASSRTVLDFFGGIALTFGISMTIGQLMFQQYTAAAVSAAIAAMGGLWVYHWYQREVKIIDTAER